MNDRDIYVRHEEAKVACLEAEVRTAQSHRIAAIALAFQRLAFGASALIAGASLRALIGA